MNRCYKFHLTPANWTEAFTICHAEQSYLAIINSKLEDEVLVNITAEAPKENIEGGYLRGAVHLGFHDRNGIWETIKGIYCIKLVFFVLGRIFGKKNGTRGHIMKKRHVPYMHVVVCVRK